MNKFYLDERSTSDIRNIFTKAVGREIYLKRRALGMTGQELANLIHVSQQQVSRYERGVCNITVDTLILILTILNISIENFFKAVYLHVYDAKKNIVDGYPCVFL